MYFDYHDWRCQLRDKKVTLNYGVNLRGMKIIRHTEFWFYHFCDHPNKKPKGKTESKPPGERRPGISIRKGEDNHQYIARWCQTCGKEMPWSVKDYFAKACELWRLAAP